MDRQNLNAHKGFGENCNFQALVRMSGYHLFHNHHQICQALDRWKRHARLFLLTPDALSTANNKGSYAKNRPPSGSTCRAVFLFLSQSKQLRCNVRDRNNGAIIIHQNQLCAKVRHDSPISSPKCPWTARGVRK